MGGAADYCWRSSTGWKEKLLHHVFYRWCTWKWPGVFLKIVWETPNLAIVHVGCFDLDSRQRSLIVADLAQEIWSVGGHVAPRRRDRKKDGHGCRGGVSSLSGDRGHGVASNTGSSSTTPVSRAACSSSS
ncbi:unnamed protein product, partial [Discosporangium mesarthrocarpum]